MSQSESTPAVSYKFPVGRMEIYIDGILRLDMAWTGPKPANPETDPRLRKLEKDLLADDTDSMSAVVGGSANLVGAGFRQASDNVWRK
jgi:hypothetical protein